MKKFALILLTLAMCISCFAACGKKSDGKSSKVIEREDYNFDDFSEYITLCDYKDMTLDYVIKRVTEDDIESKIASDLSGAKTNQEITDRAVEEGDIVNIDFVGKYKDTGEAFDGGSAEGQDLTIGSGQFIPGFEEELIGHNIGDEFSFDITFPEDYDAANLAGVETTFDIKINSISIEVEPELNEDFVKSLELDDVTTVEEYREYIKSDLETSAEETTKSNKISALWNVIMEDSEVVKYPEKELETAVTKTKASLESQLQMYGMTVDDYIEQYCDNDQEKYNESLTDQAKNNVKSYLIVYAIAKDLDINLTEGDYDEGLEKYYKDYEDYYKKNNMDPEYKTIEEFKEYADQNDFSFYLLYEKVSDKLLGMNTFVEKEETSIEDYIASASAEQSEESPEEEESAAAEDTKD